MRVCVLNDEKQVVWSKQTSLRADVAQRFYTDTQDTANGIPPGKMTPGMTVELRPVSGWRPGWR